MKVVNFKKKQQQKKLIVNNLFSLDSNVNGLRKIKFSNTYKNYIFVV